MTVAYATAEEYTTFADVAADADVDRLLERASELIDDTVRATFTISSSTSLPTDTTIAAAMRDATCAQVEYWVTEVGEEHDIAGMGNRQVSIGHLSMDHLPPVVAPRARRFLSVAGLLNPVPVSGNLSTNSDLAVTS